MFEELYTRPGIVRHHREAPLATEREAYLRVSAARGFARGTLSRQAPYVHCVAVELRAPDRCFTHAEVRISAQALAARQFPEQQAPRPRRATENLQIMAEGFLGDLGKLRVDRSGLGLSELESKLDEFVFTQRQSHWQAEAKYGAGRWQHRSFPVYLNQCRVGLRDVSVDHIDAKYREVALHWKRSSLQRSVSVLRRRFTFAAERGWPRPGLAALIETRRILWDAGLPLSPAWRTVAHMLPAIEADTPGPVRDRVILLLLSMYCLRSDEVRHARVDGIDWGGDRIRFMRSKSRRATGPAPACGRRGYRRRPLGAPPTNSGPDAANHPARAVPEAIHGGPKTLWSATTLRARSPRMGMVRMDCSMPAPAISPSRTTASRRSGTISVTAARPVQGSTPRWPCRRYAKWRSKIWEVLLDSSRGH